MKLFFYSSKWATFEITNTWKIQNCILSLGGFLRRLVRSAGLQVLLVSILCQYRGADRSLTRSGRKQARKHVRDARDFNNIETRAVIRFFFFPRQDTEGNSRHSYRNIILFLSWSGWGLISTPVQLFVTDSERFSVRLDLPEVLYERKQLTRAPSACQTSRMFGMQIEWSLGICPHCK